MRNWFRGMWAWAREMRALWLTVLVIAAAVLYIAIGPGQTPDRFRYAGTFLQILGVGTVWWGFEKTRKLFGFDYSVRDFMIWLRRVPLTATRRNVTVQLHGVATSSATVSATLSVKSGDNSTEGRLKALEQSVKELETRFTGRMDRMDSRLDSVKQEHEKALQAQGARVTDVERRLLAAQTGGLSLSLAGLVWLALGVMWTSIPNELTRLLCAIY